MRTILLVCLLLLPLTVLATQTRLQSMGNIHGVVADDADVSLYPQTVALYDGLFTLESESDAITDMGANWRAGQGAFGLTFSTMGHTTLPLTYDRQTIDHRLHAVYGRTIAGIPLGVTLGWYGSTGENVESGEFDRLAEWNLRCYEVLVGATLIDGHLDMAAGMASRDWEERLWSVSGDEYVDATVPLNAGDRTLRARWWGDPRGKCRFSLYRVGRCDDCDRHGRIGE